eukprot:TRINITY_DN9736_c0_g1_i1.p1 TRINITY_DN9736_c0_g1~~TRINITY_DN9736_c0_g1_i1.p1  ORF type:complete len:545 (+),score=103.45 TRINITY_DN9736_c0_g1_i1:140-1774(+)
MPEDNQQLWLPLLVKAFAKAHGRCYGRLVEIGENRDHPGEFLQNILGVELEPINLKERAENVLGSLARRLSSPQGFAVAYEKGMPMPVLVTAVDVKSKTISVLHSTFSEGVLGRTEDQKEKILEYPEFLGTFDRLFTAQLETDTFALAATKPDSSMNRSAAYRLKIEVETNATIYISQPLYIGSEGGRFGNIRCLIARETPYNLDYVSGTHGVGQKTASVKLKLMPGSYLVIAEVDRRVQNGDVEVENNQMTFSIRADVKPEYFQRICDIDVAQAMRATLRSYAYQLTLSEEVHIFDRNEKDEPIAFDLKTFAHGFLVGFFLNEGRKNYEVDFSPHEKEFDVGEVLSPMGLGKNEHVKAVVGSGRAQFVAIRAVMKVEVPYHYMLIMISETQDPPTPPTDDKETFVDPRTFSVSPAHEQRYFVEDVRSMIVRRYIIRNGALHQRKWRNLDSPVFVYTLSDANGLYLLYENKSLDIRLEEKITINYENLRLVSLQSPLYSANVSSGCANLHLILDPGKSTIIFLESIGSNGFQYTISNYFRVASI